MRRRVATAAALASLTACRARRESEARKQEAHTARTLEKLYRDSSAVVAMVRLEAPKIVLEGNPASPRIEADRAELVVLSARGTELTHTEADSARAVASVETSASQAQAVAPALPPWWLLGAAALILLAAWRGIRSRR